MIQSLNTVATDPALDAIARGKPVIISQFGPNPAVAMVVAARSADAPMINLLAQSARGLICLTLTPPMRHRLGLRMQPRRNARPGQPDFTQSIEARQGVTTGISAADRAATIAAAIAPGARAHDIATPGHVFPVVVNPRGLAGRTALAEACHDLIRIANAGDAAVYCEVLDDDGAMLSPRGAADLADTLGLAHLDMAALPRLTAAPARFQTQSDGHHQCSITGAQITDFGNPNAPTLLCLGDAAPLPGDAARTVTITLPGNANGQLPAAIRILRAYFDQTGLPPTALSPATDTTLAALWAEWTRHGPLLFDATTDNPLGVEPAPI